MPQWRQFARVTEGRSGQLVPALVVPVIALISVRCMEAGLGAYVSAALGVTAICSMLCRDSLDAAFWKYCIAENSPELWEMRDRRQVERFVVGKFLTVGIVTCGVGYHLSRGDYSGAAVPAFISSLLILLKPAQGRYIIYFINGFAFEFFCWERGGGPDEAFLWSPVMALPIANLLYVQSVSMHAAFEMWRLAAVLHFCALPDLRLAVCSLCAVLIACRVLEGNYDMQLVSSCRMERQVNEFINSERRQLVGVLSHEVRNRLDILINLVARLETAPEESAIVAALPEGMRQRGLLRTTAELQQSVSIILDLLGIEDVPRGTLTGLAVAGEKGPAVPRKPSLPTPTAVHVRPMVHSAQQLQIAALNERGRVDAAAVPFFVHVDAALCERPPIFNKDRLHWILCHLIANAYDGCGTGPEASVEVRATLREACVVFEVVNAGEAHAQADLDQALNTHRQAVSSPRRRWGGHGLGLRHTAAMLKLLGCDAIELRARGTTVTARFAVPYVADGTPSESSRSSERSAEAAKPVSRAPRLPVRAASALRSVLVVDDEDFIRELTVMSLEAQCKKCKVETAENGDVAVRKFLERREEESPEFDLILMDIQMPVLCGDAAARQMRALELSHGWPHTCIIARSANSAEADREVYKACGMDGCIPKSGNIAKQLVEVLELKLRYPDEFVVIEGCDRS